MRYALAAPMSDLVACPFCRQLFEPGEASACPDCGLGLKDLGKLPPSYDAKIEYPEEPSLRTWRPCPGRTVSDRAGMLILALAVLGFAAFFAPWVQRVRAGAPVLSGFDLARLSGFFWAPAVAWFVLFPLVLTRRSIFKMRGARVAVGFLAAIALVTVGSSCAPPRRRRRSAPCASSGDGGFRRRRRRARRGAGGVSLRGQPRRPPHPEERQGGETLH